MSRREDVETEVWRDPDFRALPPDAKLVYFWSFTHGCNMAGLYKLDEETVRHETRLPPKRVKAALDKLEAEHFVLRHHPYIWVRARVAHIRSRGPAMANSVASVIGSLRPDHPLRIAFLEEYGEEVWLSKALSSIVIESGVIEPQKRPSTDPPQRVHGNGNGNGVVKEPSYTTSENSKDDSRDFDAWLADHEAVTGLPQPKVGTKARRARLAEFSARRSEGWSLDDLKAATLGAFTDQWRRERGHYDPESVLRPTKVDKLVGKGRGASSGPILTAADRGVTDMLAIARRMGEEDAA